MVGEEVVKPTTKKIEEFLRNNWTSFCKTTGIRGFSFLTSAESHLEKFLWAATIIAGIYLTISDVNTTWQKFNSGSTTTRLSLAIDKPFKMHHLTFCMSFNETLSNGKLEGIVNTEDQATARNLLSLMNDELEVTSRITGFRGNRSRNYDHIGETKGQNLLALMHNLSAKLLCSLDIQLKIQKVNEEIPRQSWDCKNVQSSWFGPSTTENFPLICLKTVEDYNFTNFVDHLWLILNPDKFIFLLNRFVLFFHADAMLHPDLDNVIRMKKGYDTEVLVRRLGRYRMMTRPNFQCSDENSQFNCKIESAANKIVDQCKCQPLFSAFFNFSKNHKICNFAKSENFNCNWNEKSMKPEEQCKLPCLWEIYSFVVTYTQTALNLTRADLSVDSFLFPTFEEIALMDGKQFLTQLGGNLSLWLGASFIVILHVLTFILRLPYSYWNLHSLTLLQTFAK